ncbi:branched-chain amino acid ABC transporter permease [Paracoccus jeotgali]|uniref:branched-chain amino acid ABC transporter permease n=1 Tax=Paracoccus jeotgali TaxID=2065379 RepID=UPI001CEF8BFD|nr:branched-chain amino acid ABC transporter permease [Paracoccus jeotgali]
MSSLLIWLIFAAALLVAPLIFSQGASISFLCQMGAMTIFALSYNILLGQTGMLSFGHAVYYGLGAFGTIHAMNWANDGGLAIPLVLMPLVGGLVALIAGVVLGYVTTKKSGVVFAMITLGIGELVFAGTHMFPAIFGGEGGISTNRVYGTSFLGFTFGPQIQVYYLIAAWLFISTVAMYALAQTPLGRLANAVRDNPERVEFIGFSTHWIRYLMLVLSGSFAGIAGALTVINFELVGTENVSLALSGAILLFTFIGGTSYFYGPIIGAIVGTFMTAVLSGYTPAWQLYLGVSFILVVLYLPGGIASLFDRLALAAARRMIGCVALPTLSMVVTLMVLTAGAVIAVEMLYHITLHAADGPIMQLFGRQTDTTSPANWLVAMALVIMGSVGLRMALPGFRAAWEGIDSGIAHEPVTAASKQGAAA